jgi:hypothetical protein
LIRSRSPFRMFRFMSRLCLHRMCINILAELLRLHYCTREGTSRFHLAWRFGIALHVEMMNRNLWVGTISPPCPRNGMKTLPSLCACYACRA